MFRFPFLRPLALTAFIAACYLALPLCAQTPAPLPRIAIVPGSEDKELSTLADLLIVSMGQASHGYEMVERAELKRIEQEAGVQRMNIAERPRALARLAKADGLILLTLEQVDPLHRSISARLSSTSSGLIQKTVMLPAGGKELPMAAKLAADALQHSAERLGTAGNTPKHIVSLLGIRAAVNSAPSIALETTLNAAVTHHLGRIPGLAVVERWKLDDVAFERSLSEKDMPPLATGTTLVNGSFELKAGVVVVKVRLRNSEKDAGKTLVVEGPSEDAFALAEAIASKVAAECGSHTTPAAWDARAEAAAYAKLGEWLLGLRMGIAAAQAYESAVALGDKSAETLTGRIEAYVRVSSPALGLLFDVSTYHSDDRRLAEGKKHFQVDLVGATRAAAYCGEFAGRFPDMDSHSKKGVDLVGETVRKACDVLIAAHRLRVHMEQPGEVATLRQQTESLVKVIKHREERFSRFKLDGYAGYWAATPEDAVERWRELLKPEVPPGYLCWHRRMTLQGQRIGMKWGQPFIPDWTTPDDSLGSAAWQRLIAELSASKSLISQADAIALSAYSAATQAEVDKLQTQYIEFMERNRAALAHPEGHALFYVYDPLQNFPVMAEKCERYASLLTSAFTDSANIEMHALDGIRHAILHFKTSELDFNQKRKVSKEAGAKLLKAITDFSTRARTAGLPTSYRGHGYSGPDELAQLLAGIFRDLTDAPSTERPASGVPVRYLNLQLPGDRSDSSAWVNCYRMGQIEDRLIVQRLSEDGFVSVRGDLSMELIPPLPGGDFQRPQLFPAKDGFLFLSRENGLWRYGYQEKKWSEVPGIPHQKEQIVGMVGDAFYIAGGGTIGRVKAGRYELIASSRRRPEEHPLDALPLSARAFFPGAKGRPYAILNRENAQGLPACELYDLELKKPLVLLNGSTGAICEGSRTVLWDGCLLAVVDASSELPKVLIRQPKGIPFTSDDLPSEAVWEWPGDGPYYGSYPGRLHTGYRPVMRNDCLFVLKDIDRLSRTPPYGADELSLLCFRPGTRNAVEIPLDYQPTEAMKSYTRRGNPVLVRPDIVFGRVIGTTKGIFFGPFESPGLLYVTWADVDGWLANNGFAARTGTTDTSSAPANNTLDVRPAKP